MGKQLYFDNYTAASDVTVLAICVVIAVLIATSYVTKTRTFIFFLNMLICLSLAVLSNMILHDSYAHITDGNYTFVYVMRILYHVFLFTIFLLYIAYSLDVLRLDRKESIPIMVISTAIYVLVIMADIITTVQGSGFHIDRDGTASSKVSVFIFGYVTFIVVVAYIMIKYRTMIYKKVLFGLIGTICVSFFFLYAQVRYGHSSLTVATFLFPTIAIMYLLHSNPYDIKTGTISAASLTDAVRYNYSRKRDHYMISLYLSDFYSERKPLPKDFQGVIREFPSRFFKKSVLFQVNNGDMLLMIPGKFNPDGGEKFKDFTDAFMKEYDKYHFDFKLIMGKSIEEISRKNEYLSFIKSIRRRMPLNTVHMITDEDVADYNRAEYILGHLEDINKKQDLNDKRVVVYCQPVLNIKTGKYDTAEALMRLDLSHLGLVYPDRFISLAEEHDYIHVLTRIILNKTCEAISSMLAEGYEVKRISVNVSMSELRDENFAGDIEDIIDKCGIPDGKVAIEITESRSDSDFEILKNVIDKLKDKGIKFYLDDFGTGYSNMERIMKLPFDIIKFDRSLVLASQSDERSAEIVGRLAGIFADLHYSVLYEGIENDTDETRCRDMSASYLQGYKYSRPIPIEELRNFFSKVKE